MALPGALQQAAAPLLAASYWHRILTWQVIVAVSAALLFGLQRLPPGLARAAVAAPLIALNSLVPFLFDGDRDLNTNMSSFVVATLSSFKALGWVLNRGPLVRPLGPLQFLAVYSLPVTPREELGAVSGERGAAAAASAAGRSKKQGEGENGATATTTAAAPVRHGRLGESGGSPGLYLAKFLAKVATVVGVGYFLSAYPGQLPRLAKTCLWNVLLYAGLSAGMDAPAALVGALLGLELTPHFDSPHLATSLGELWSRRWNLTVGNLFRLTVYEPIMELRLVKRPGAPAPKFSPLRRLLGVLAVFFVSGVVHEVMFWVNRGYWLGGAWLMYFELWGGCVVTEAVVRGVLKKRGIWIPKWLGWVYTTAIATFLVDRFWWGPLVDTGIVETSTQHALDGVKQAAAVLRARLAGSSGGALFKEL